MKSVLQNEKVCFVCKREQELHDHHIFYGTANRKLSQQWGFKVWLCAAHHNMSKEGVHFNPELDQQIKGMAQTYFEKNKGNRATFIRIFGRSYL